MTSGTWMGQAKDRLPRPVKDAANSVTRAYGMATVRWRPPPDFLVIGTKRGGTTSVWNYLIAHPNVEPMFPRSRGLKSPYYFFENLDRGDTWYRSHFPTSARRHRTQRRVDGPVVTGEASPYYMYDPRIAARVREVAPDAKAIVLLRDPVRRAYSHYQERVGQGVEPLSFEDALAAEDGRLHGELDRMLADPLYYSTSHDFYSYRDRGLYAPQLENWFKEFPEEQVLVQLSEDLYREPRVVLDAVADFLGIPPAEVPTSKRHNYIPAERMKAETEASLRDFYREPNLRLAELLGRDLPW